jgi:hypothetical protein
MTPVWLRCAFLLGAASALCRGAAWREDGQHVFPGESIQAAIEAAARHPTNKVVKVHAGVYRPDGPRQALLWFNRRHDGVRLEAVGAVTLTAANEQVSDPQQPGHPAVVNHIVYFGDGVSPRTVLKGFTLTGANHFVTTNGTEEFEPNAALGKGLFFFADGGAVKIFGRSFPTIDGCVFTDNYASPCAGGISVEHGEDAPGAGQVTIVNCVFRRNRAQVTGAAVDLLPGSAALISNCLFVANVANLGVNYISPNRAQPEFTNSAPLTVFPASRALVQRCTFTDNRNAVDDLGRASVYERCIFWRNTRGGAFYGGMRYELDLQGTARVSGCFFGGAVKDPNRCVSAAENVLDAPAPDFDAEFVPRAAAYRNAGYRPVRAPDGAPK